MPKTTQNRRSPWSAVADSAVKTGTNRLGATLAGSMRLLEVAVGRPGPQEIVDGSEQAVQRSHAADADVAAGQGLVLRRYDAQSRAGVIHPGAHLLQVDARLHRLRRAEAFGKLQQVPTRQWMLPHEGVHRRRQDHGIVPIPGAPNTREAIVAQAVG